MQENTTSAPSPGGKPVVANRTTLTRMRTHLSTPTQAAQAHPQRSGLGHDREPSLLFGPKSLTHKFPCNNHLYTASGRSTIHSYCCRLPPPTLLESSVSFARKQTKSTPPDLTRLSMPTFLCVFGMEIHSAYIRILNNADTTV